MHTTHPHPTHPRPRRSHPTAWLRWAAPLLLAATLAACGDDARPVQAGAPPTASARTADAASRYVELQLDRAADAAHQADGTHRAAQAAAARNYVAGLEHRAGTADALS
jgi:hypothetical protein